MFGQRTLGRRDAIWLLIGMVSLVATWSTDRAFRTQGEAATAVMLVKSTTTNRGGEISRPIKAAPRPIHWIIAALAAVLVAAGAILLGFGISNAKRQRRAHQHLHKTRIVDLMNKPRDGYRSSALLIRNPAAQPPERLMRHNGQGSGEDR